MSLQHAYSSQQSNHLDPHHHSTFASATVVKTHQPPVASGEVRFQLAPTSTGANHVVCTTSNKDFERLIQGFPAAQCNIFETHADQSSVPNITLPLCVTAIEQVSGEAPRLPTAPRGHVTLLSNDESRGVVVSVLDLVQRCSVLNLVLDSALLRDNDGNAVGVDHDRLVELAGRDDCAVPTEAPIEALQHFVAWVEHHRDTAPSRLLPDQPLASVEMAIELFDDPFDYALMRLISPEVCDENTPWLDITARPIQLLVAANLAATLGCDAYLGAVVHYLDFYARKELRHVGDTVAVARLWLEREGHKSVDSLLTPEHMSAATAWLARAVPNARPSVY